LLLQGLPTRSIFADHVERKDTAVANQRFTDAADEPDHIAPDGSEIRLLTQLASGGLAECTLRPGRVSSPVRHQTVEELWYFLEGEGEVWRDSDDDPVPVSPGRSLNIPVGVGFQFRNTGSAPLRFIIATIPQWPGPQEAEPLDEGRWTA
jgi:mannose-6-phosphate isomerase-like protein (cupin superfamily)